MTIAMSPAIFASSLSPSRARRNSVEIEIKLNDHHDHKIYRPGAAVHGDVAITTREDIRFDSVAVVLTGISKVHVATAGSSRDISHVFLLIDMPILQSLLPPVFEANHTYSFPFSFVIPEQLTLGACNHNHHSRAVFDQHIRLPPSMGSWSKDDLSPKEARAEYTIKAYVARGTPESSGSSEKIMLASHLINVLPDSVEDPPLHITLQDETYTLSSSKTVRKNLFTAKQGLVKVVTTQPSAIRLSADGNVVSKSAVIISLRFDPVSPETPCPTVSHIFGNIVATTWLSGIAMRALPDLGDKQPRFGSPTKQSCSVAIPLVFPDLRGGVKWTKQQVESTFLQIFLGQPSHSAKVVPEEESTESSAFHYEATLRVPFEIAAQDNMLLPTFHTCYTSRTYSLRLNVYAADTKFSLDVPVQIVVVSETKTSPNTWSPVVIAQ